jgi:ParB family chromosome partitioning protein
MGKELKKKASLVFAPRPAIQPSSKGDAVGHPLPTSDALVKPKTAIGGMAQFTNRQSEVLKEAEELRGKVKDLTDRFEGALPARKIDPKLIVRSKWANRHDDSFKDAEFASLKEEIANAKGNVQPIKVRELKGGQARYEIVFGQRRHQACLELGLDVLAMVEDLDDKGLFVQMDRENRQRKDLRPFEMGAMYNKALEEGLFPSQRQLALDINVDQSQLAKAINLAKLPADVIKAFVSPLDLQYRWASDLVAAIQKDPDFVLACAKDIQATVPRLDSNAVFARLIGGRGTVPQSPNEPIKLEGKGDQKGTLVLDSVKGTAQIKLSNITPVKLEKLQSIIKEFLSK